MHPIKVLMADDEVTTLEIMAKSVRAQGYEVVTASDGEEAWLKIASEHPDLIVLDLAMPKLDGWSVLGRLRGGPPVKRWQPVIIISGENELDTVKKGLDLEADHYLTKPCRIEDVVKAIRLMASLMAQRNP